MSMLPSSFTFGDSHFSEGSHEETKKDPRLAPILNFLVYHNLGCLNYSSELAGLMSALFLES